MSAEEEYKKYKSDLGEIAVKLVFEKLGNLTLNKILEKKNQSNPDYEIKRESEVIAICEVKSLLDLMKNEPSDIEMGSEAWDEYMRKRDRNHRTKIRSRLGEAIFQLSKISGLPTIVYFVNFDMTDHIDMAQVLQDYVGLHREDKIPDLFIMMKIHQPIEPSNEFVVKDPIQIYSNSEIGAVFGKEHLNWENAIKRAGTLPLVFEF